MHNSSRTNNIVNDNIDNHSYANALISLCVFLLLYIDRMCFLTYCIKVFDLCSSLSLGSKVNRPYNALRLVLF